MDDVPLTIWLRLLSPSLSVKAWLLFTVPFVFQVLVRKLPFLFLSVFFPLPVVQPLVHRVSLDNFRYHMLLTTLFDLTLLTACIMSTETSI